MDGAEYNISGATTVRNPLYTGLTREVEEWLLGRQIDPMITRSLDIVSTEECIGYPRKSMLDNSICAFKWRSITSKNVFLVKGVSNYSEKDMQPLLWDKGNARLLITEGETDFMRVCGQASIDVLCVPGSSAFNPKWVNLINRWPSVYASPDPDAAGQKLMDAISHYVPRCKFINTHDRDLCDFMNSSPLSTQYIIDTLCETARFHIPTVKQAIKVGRDRSKYTPTDKPDIVSIIDKLCSPQWQKTYEGYKCTCPLHDDKTASFNVNEKKQLYYCFGCNSGGDVYQFAMEWFEDNFSDAKDKIIGL